MFTDQIKTDIRQAMRDKDILTRDLLRVVLGDIQTQAAREGAELSDADAQKVVRKMVKSTDETIAALTERGQDAQAIEKAQAERVLLQSLLPQTLSVDQIVQALEPVADALCAAGNAGQATGIAMKHLKASDAAVEGKTVAQAVQQLRSR